MNEDKRAKSQQEDGRPDPDELLRRYGFQDTAPSNSDSGELAVRPPGTRDHPQGRGRLRVYLASAAGSGKTYSMLNEGHRRKVRGTDVVVGYVETHKRSQTEMQIGDLEVMPRKKIPYKGTTLEEMDTEGVLARHPEVALVDELAHTNVPGSKHTKRYQDVQEILDAGIDVVTTLNIQHLESLNDLVASITGIRVRETLPDWILDQADEVELIDISPHALRQRMRHGNIYPPERIEAALSNFFREGNLTALRELALRRTAEKTETQLQQYMTEHHITDPWTATERVLVGFDHRAHTRQVIRDAWRLAHGLHAELLAVVIQPTGYPAFINKITGFLRYGSSVWKQREQNRQRLEEHIIFAEDLGAEVIRLSSRDVASALIETAQKRQVTQIVLGLPARSRWEELVRGSTINKVLRLNAKIDIHLVPHSREER
jgi:two-component system sensor histidine kinase KdpD